MSSISSDNLAISQILSSLPVEWTGTTFKNDKLLGREGFARNLTNLIATTTEHHTSITTADLELLGNAEDYLRVATNIATTLEVFLARQRNLTIEQVFTFASVTMPAVSVVLTSKYPVHLFISNHTDHPFHPHLADLLSIFGGQLLIHGGLPQTTDISIGDKDIVLVYDVEDNQVSDNVDGLIKQNVLYILNQEKILPNDILVIRKRMATPITTPMAIDALKQIAGIEEHNPKPQPQLHELAELYSHLQVLSGTDVNANCHPVIGTAGLSTIASLWFALASRGGAEIVMASTAYGGSSQLVDILTDHSGKLRKHTFHIQGQSQIVASIKEQLELLAVQDASTLLPLIVLFVEIPSNPDMKIPPVTELAEMVKVFEEKTKKPLLLLLDTTFAPGSRVMKKFHDIAPELPVISFISLSKSVSRGLTTAGTLVANHTSFATTLLAEVSQTASLLDTYAKPDQLIRLIENHSQVDARCLHAYQVAREVGEHLQRVVKAVSEYEMPLAFPTEEQAGQGFTSSTFSFNLPALVGATAEQNEALAQQFVDLLCKHTEFKPCVSFGQDNGLVYATVPATSTQGAIKAEDKAKQAVGGVQLVRLSFPPLIDVPAVNSIMEQSIRAIYAPA